jgi:hypothetical protein
MKKYNSWGEVLADATLGKLEWSNKDASQGLYPFLITSKVTGAQVKTLLALVATTEPNQDWVKGNWLDVTNDGKLLMNPKGMPTPATPSPLPPLNSPFSGSLGGLNALFSKNLWIRVAEFAIGGILLAVGANALMKQATGVDVARTGMKVAKTGAKVAAL